MSGAIVRFDDDDDDDPNVSSQFVDSFLNYIAYRQTDTQMKEKHNLLSGGKTIDRKLRADTTCLQLFHGSDITIMRANSIKVLRPTGGWNVC